LLAEIRKLAESRHGTRVIRSGHPRTTLERLFLEETRKGDAAPEKELADD
ncbi:MAG: hypothetical protein HKN82_04845, partial [Akkermansiaceae bacterium]|nr:hypothetical protein [Akkermansiaceae bacterium]